MLRIDNGLPVRSVPELIALLKAEPGKHAYATPGVGTPMHLTGELLKRMAGVEMAHVPYRGGAAGLLDLLGGRVSMQLDAITGPMQAVREGKVRALAVTGPGRNPALPDVPAVAEFLPGFDTASWTCVCGPSMR